MLCFRLQGNAPQLLLLKAEISMSPLSSSEVVVSIPRLLREEENKKPSSARDPTHRWRISSVSVGRQDADEHVADRLRPQMGKANNLRTCAFGKPETKHPQNTRTASRIPIKTVSCAVGTSP